ncbi:hypothetical protein GCM10009677_30100 [Sphaerisporangium rubeum]|uniref:Uncharacterized protein n=1 Tax=Sphaerisporangium rubeum TaxID=321317 RepID=A0A7X0IEN6_9ACTN|nr:hypothetical protein [Sphaerisporangium rubeum]MBB6473650.1 hypothetical protein [Sphaerisporangium rubeum]
MDVAGWVLGFAVWLMPGWRGGWGDAMRGELAHIDGGTARWWFAVSCLRGVVLEPRWMLVAGGHLVPVVAVVVGTRELEYAPMRAGVVGMVTVLVVLSWLAGRRGVLGPVRGGWVAGSVRWGGFVVVGGAAGLVVHGFAGASAGVAEKAEIGVPVCTAVLVLYAVAFAVVTARWSPATGRALAIGGVCGAGAAAEYMVAALLRPPLATGVSWAVATVVTSGAAALLIAANSGGGVAQGVMAGLCAAVFAALVIFTAAEVLLQFAPAWVPDTSPVNVAPADRLANNRAGAEDQYFGLLGLGGLTAVALTLLTSVSRRRA